MKLYTRQGDEGETSLFGGRRVPKTSARIEAYGTVDELNSVLGLARAALRVPQGGPEPVEGAACSDARLAEMLDALQRDLFVAGGDLAAPGEPGDRKQRVPAVTEADVARLESWIDQACEPLPEMKHFILPGGCELSARLHVARAVCRRAERAVLLLGQSEKMNRQVAVYLNRLSDLLFAMARRANQLAGVEDIPWQPRGK